MPLLQQTNKQTRSLYLYLTLIDHHRLLSHIEDTITQVMTARIIANLFSCFTYSLMDTKMMLIRILLICSIARLWPLGDVNIVVFFLQTLTAAIDF